MKFRTILGTVALIAATAIPAIAPAQRYHHSHRLRSYGSGYGHGPFYPSWIPGPSGQYFGTQHYRAQHFRSGGPYRINGLTYYFGPGGATYYQAAPYGYGVYRTHRDSRFHRSYPIRSRHHRH
jgi:hypothetical protein